MSWLARLAADAPTPVFAVAGVDAWGAVQELRGDPRIRLAATPRHAAVLLVAGTILAGHGEALRRVHDQLPRPRAVVVWRAPGTGPAIPALAVVDGSADEVVSAVGRAHASILADPTRAQADLLPDEEPTEWRGVGPFGQGGEGMMGGTPYGRPMAMTGDDRDGLALDQLHLTLGPFLDPLPPGLTLDVTLQGEVLQDVAVDRAAPPVVDHAAPGDPATPAAAARRGLHWLAHALHVEGLDALAGRAAHLASQVAVGDVAADRSADRLARLVTATGVLRSLRGVGAVDGADASDRWRQRLAAIVAALRDGVVPRALEPAPSDDAALAGLLVGVTLTDAVSTLVSLELPGVLRPAVAA